LRNKDNLNKSEVNINLFIEGFFTVRVFPTAIHENSVPLPFLCFRLGFGITTSEFRLCK